MELHRWWRRPRRIRWRLSPLHHSFDDLLLGSHLRLLIISLFFDAPLEDLANPLVTPNPGKAPWYFTGIQELIHYTNKPVIPAIIIPLLIVVWLVLIPYIDRKPKTRFTSFLNRIFIGGERTANIDLPIHLFRLWGPDLHHHRLPLPR